MDRNEFPLDQRHVGVPSFAPKMIFKPMVCSAQTVHLSCVEINTISKRTKMSFHMTHVTKEYHRVCQNDFQAYGAFGANRLPILSRDENYLQMDPNEFPLDPRHVGVPSVAPNMISKPFLCSAQTMHLSCVEFNTISKRTEMSFHITHVT